MRKLLIILLLFQFFLFYSYADQKEEKGKVVVIDPDDTSMIYDWPLWLFNHGYTSHYNSDWSTGRGSRTVVIRKPLSFRESFLLGLGKGMSRGMDNYYRRKEQKRYTETMLKLLESLSNKDYRPKYSQPQRYVQPKRFFVPDREAPALWLEKQKKKEKEQGDIAR